MSIEAMKQVIQKLRIGMTDARQNESHFESWMILNEAICDSIDDLRQAIEQAEKQEPVALKHRLVKIHDALCNKLGDTDPYIDEDMTDEEICKELPVFWAAKEIADLIGDAPWTDYTSPPQRQPLTDEHVTDGTKCWCEPELDYKDPDTGAEVWIHRGKQ